MAVPADRVPGERFATDPPSAFDGLLRILVEQWPGAVLLFDADSRLTWCNRLATHSLPVPAPLRPGTTARALFEHWQISEHWDGYCANGLAVLLPEVKLAGSPPHTVRLRLQPLLRDAATVATLCVLESCDRDPTSGPVVLVPMRADASEDPDLLKRIDAAVLAARGAVWEWHVVERRLTLSDGYFHLLGFNPQEARERESFWKTRIHPADIAPLRNHTFRHVRGDEDVFEREYRVQHADGRWVWVLDRGCVTARNAQGRVTVMSGMLMDITARRTAEAALRESEARFRLATEIANGVIYEVDMGTDTAARYGLERLTGYTSAELAPTFDGWLNLVVEEDRARLREVSFANRKTGTSYDVEYRLLTKDGRVLYLWHRGGYVHDVHGRPVKAFGFIEDVSARVLAEQALRASEFRFRAVAQLIAGYVFESRMAPDGSGAVMFVSESFRDVMGGSRDEFDRAGGWERFGDANSQQIMAKTRDLLLAGVRTDTELHGYNLAGEEKWLRMRSLPVYDPLTGQLSGNIGAATDITEAKRSDLALRRSQSILQTIAEGSAAQLSLFDLEGHCVFVNRALAGHTLAQMMNGSIEDVLDPNRPAYARQIFEQVVATGIGVDLERSVINPENGEHREIELRLRPVIAIGKAVAVVLNITDVTELRRQQQDLRLQARIIATMREGVLVADANGRICLTNSAFDRMFGYQSGELVGRFAGELSALSAPAYEKLRQRVVEQLRSGEFEPTEVEALRRDGTRFIASCAFAPIESAGERRVAAMLSDITGHKQLEREILHIANREQQRIGSDLHDGLGQDLTGVALLLRSLAARVSRAADRALRDELEPDVEQIIALVNDAIDSTRSLARGLSPVTAERDGLVLGLEAMASQVRERYGVVVTFNQNLDRFDEDYPLIDDSTNTHLYRIAQEAVVNAVRHGKAKHIAIRLSTTAQSIELTIRDDGRGFAVRGPQPASPAGGMGLKIMRYRARMIAAVLLIDSVPGDGTLVQCHWGATGT